MTIFRITLSSAWLLVLLAFPSSAFAQAGKPTVKWEYAELRHHRSGGSSQIVFPRSGGSSRPSCWFDRFECRIIPAPHASSAAQKQSYESSAKGEVS